MNLFPPGIAEGTAFCNRVVERQWLKENVERIQHTVIMAPRRYGKSSLITCVIQENGLPNIWIDFLSVATKEDVVSKILKGAKQLLFELSPELKKLKQQAKDFVKSLTPELSLGMLGQSITFHLGNEENTSIDEVLLQLDEYAGKKNKQAIIVFDEFQQISELKENATLEALIRHAVERSKNITYIFSGSNRHLLQEIFGKSSRPLYRLCQPMVIERISSSSYAPFINKAAHAKWKEIFSDEAMSLILSLTECHPFYVNALCNKLWSSKAIPTIEQIRTAWDWYVTTYKSIIVSDILNLSINQKKMIKELSKHPEKEPYSAS
jgi:AAA+ ATPase superfamily predicted ATPase